MLNQLYQSYMHFAWILYSAFCYIFSALILVVGFKLAWHIAFGEGILTIRLGRLIILEVELITNPKKK